MNSKLNRRGFFGASLAATAFSTAVISPSGLLKILTNPEASVQVFGILQNRLGLLEGHRRVVETFTQSLRTSSGHHESPARFEAKLAGAIAPGELLEIYVLQEFVISTNYTAYAKGYTKDLEMRRPVAAASVTASV